MNKPTVNIAELSDDAFSQQMSRALRELPDVPLPLQRAALGLFTAKTGASTLLGLVEAAVAQIHAVLSFDSWAAPAMAGGMRSLRSPTRHLLFSAQGRDVDLRIAPQSLAAEAYSLTGQILGPDVGGQVELHAEWAGPGPAPAALSTSLDDLGEFRIEGLVRGVYRMTLHLGAEQIVLPPVEVGASAGGPGDGVGESAG